jgi:hypothetical protein
MATAAANIAAGRATNSPAKIKVEFLILCPPLLLRPPRGAAHPHNTQRAMYGGGLWWTMTTAIREPMRPYAMAVTPTSFSIKDFSQFNALTCALNTPINKNGKTIYKLLLVKEK